MAGGSLPWRVGLRHTRQRERTPAMAGGKIPRAMGGWPTSHCVLLLWGLNGGQCHPPESPKEGRHSESEDSSAAKPEKARRGLCCRPPVPSAAAVRLGGWVAFGRAHPPSPENRTKASSRDVDSSLSSRGVTGQWESEGLYTSDSPLPPAIIISWEERSRPERMRRIDDASLWFPIATAGDRKRRSGVCACPERTPPPKEMPIPSCAGAPGLLG